MNLLPGKFCLLIILLFSLNAEAQSSLPPRTQPKTAGKQDTVRRVKDNINCTYGYKDSKGKWVVPAQFTTAEDFVKGYAIVGINDKYGVINEQGKIVVPLIYTELEHFRSDVYCTDRDEYYEMDRDKGYYGEDYFDKNNQAYSIPGLFAFVENNLYGIINADNRILLPAKYDTIGNYKSGLAVIEKDSLLGYVDTLGNIVVAPRYKNAEEFEEGLAIVYDGKKAGLINTKGETVIPMQYDGIEKWDTRKTLLWKLVLNKRYGLANRSGIIFPVEADYVGAPYSEDEGNDSLVSIRENKKEGLISGTGRKILSADYDEIKVLSRMDRAIVRKDNKYGLIKLSTGKWLAGGNKYDGLCNYLYSFAAEIRSEHRVVVFNGEGKEIFTMPGDSALMGGQEIFIINDNHITIYSLYTESVVKHSRAMNRIGEVYELIGSPLNSYTASFNNDNTLHAAMDTAGNMIIPPLLCKVSYMKNGFLFEDVKNHKQFAINGRKNIVDLSTCHFVGDDNSIIATRNNKIGRLNDSWKLQIDTVFMALGYYDQTNHCTWAMPGDKLDWCNSKWGLVDSGGHFILPPVYDAPRDFNNNKMAVLSINHKCGIQKVTGEVVLPFEYDSIHALENGMYMVGKADEGYSLADANGKIISAPVYSSISNFENGYACFVTKDKYGIMDSTCTIVVSERKGGAGKNINPLQFHYPDYKEDTHNSNPYFTGDTAHCTIKDYEYGYMHFSLLTRYPNAAVRNMVNNEILFDTPSTGNAGDEDGDDNPNACYYPAFSADGSREENRDMRQILESKEFNYYLVDVHNSSFSIIEESDAGYKVSDYEGSCLNFGIKGDSVFPVKLADLFNASADYDSELNTVLVDIIRHSDNLEFDCTNPEAFVKTVKDYFTISSKGLVFYFSHSATGTDAGKVLTNTLLVPYSRIKNIINKNGVLGEFVK